MREPLTITGLTLAEVWEESLRRLLTSESVSTVDSLVGGPSVEVSVVTHASEPQLEPKISDIFIDPDLVASYQDTVLRRPPRRPDAETRSIANRIYAYPTTGARRLDQYRRVIEELKRDPPSRRAIIQLWDPAEDLGTQSTSSPSSHCFLQFTIRDGALHMLASSRSIDAWLGAPPNMVGFASLQEKLAGRLAVGVGSYSHLVFSYHVYLRDIPAAMKALSL